MKKLKYPIVFLAVTGPACTETARADDDMNFELTSDFLYAGIGFVKEF